MTYTFDLLDADDAALTWFITTHVNPKRVADGLDPFPDNQTYVTFRMLELLKPVRENFDRQDSAEMLMLYKAATLAKRADAKLVLK